LFQKIVLGDCLAELAKLPDQCIDLVITDPPYGVNWISNRSKQKEHITRWGIQNDTPEEAFELFSKVCELLDRKAKQNAHFYIFAGWRVYPEFAKIMSQYWKINNLIIWDKGNHGAGDLKSWGNRYETIIFASKGNKPINNRRGDVIYIPRINSQKLLHPTQKPISLIKILLEVSARKGDVVCDPFMGVGTIIKAVKEFGKLDYIGIEIDERYFERAKVFTNLIQPTLFSVA